MSGYERHLGSPLSKGKDPEYTFKRALCLRRLHDAGSKEATSNVVQVQVLRQHPFQVHSPEALRHKGLGI